ncbi:MAG: hypothetical protein GX496_00775 [Firmicutes bacterium]|nr:hypothetical protein [Bacillota bacterium]
MRGGMGRAWAVTATVALTGMVVARVALGAVAQGIEGVPISQKVARVYQAVSGSPPPEGSGLRDQIDAATQLLYGANWQSKVSPSLVDRVNQLVQVVSLGDPNVSLVSRMLAIEWSINQSLYEWEVANQPDGLRLPPATSITEPPLRPLRERVAWVERLLYGREQSGGLVERIDRLAREVWGSAAASRLATKVVRVSANAGQVRIRLLGTISNERDKASVPGQKVPFIVVDSLVLDGALVLPRGAIGIATVEDVQTPSLGRPGRLSASGIVWAVDGMPLGATLGLSEQAEGSGVNPLGAALSGPIAAPPGLLVQGNARTLEPGTVLVASIGPAPGWREAPVINAMVQ